MTALTAFWRKAAPVSRRVRPRRKRCADAHSTNSAAKITAVSIRATPAARAVHRSVQVAKRVVCGRCRQTRPVLCSRRIRDAGNWLTSPAPGQERQGTAMRNGFRIVDIDTHVNPSYDTLVKYLDPSARARVEELRPFVRTRSADGTSMRVLHVAPYPFDRFPGEAPQEAMVVAGGKGALEGRVTRSSSHHRVPPADGVQDENADGRIKDMDTEGRDVDFLIPGTWATAASGLSDVTLTEALYRSYHNYIGEYCQAYPSRLKSMVLVPGGDVKWAVDEVKRLNNQPWVSA